MSQSRRSRVDFLIDLLVEEVAERLQARAAAAPPPPPAVRPAPQPAAPPPPKPAPQVDAEPPAAPPMRPHAARLMARLTVLLLALVVLVNIPINRHGLTLATAMPDRQALVIRDGLVVKEEDDEEIYVYQDGRFRWITSLDAFEHFGYSWGDVHIVEDGFLDDYEIDNEHPIYVLLKCPDSPHIYRLENGTKRWIIDIATFEAEGHVWEDVRIVSCYYLRSLPDGETIPPGYGPPPQP